ncbi:MAG: hypothetical protein A2073_02660 [Deltaproteobacteria bacterium GWC2_42_11]|nr:MAG: hypothetical protein A2073_02660 [Deltaproteobacteria bacterium GWC2_42_11]HBO83827.1 dehydrogenase [Deltaproteobacteria bacterium]
MKISDNSLAGKTALVTGGAVRIGSAMVNALAKNGVNVVIHYHASEDEAEKLVKEIKKLGVNGCKVCADLSRVHETEELFKEVQSKAGKIDFLINSAAVFDKSSIPDISIENLHRTLMINSFAPLLLSRKFSKQTNKGAIINLLDSRVTRYDLKRVSYQLSKNLLCHLTKMMALEFAPDIRVNAVAPGLILPPCGKDESYIEKERHRNLLQQGGKLNNITDTIIFLLSNEFVTGETIFVDGGENLKERLLD